MSLRNRLPAVAAVTAALALATPGLAAAAGTPAPAPSSGSNQQLCLSGVVDMGPFGPLGPYGPSGPYGANGPLHGQTNPLGDAATCGGLLTYILRGGNLTSFVKANAASVGIPSPSAGR
jgi:hypothetical protein